MILKSIHFFVSYCVMGIYPNNFRQMLIKRSGLFANGHKLHQYYTKRIDTNNSTSFLMPYTIKSLGFYGPSSFDQKTRTNFNFRKKRSILKKILFKWIIFNYMCCVYPIHFCHNCADKCLWCQSVRFFVKKNTLCDYHQQQNYLWPWNQSSCRQW